MHDILDLDRRGVAGAFIASEEFVEAADSQAKSLGFSPFRAFVPHPIQNKTDAEMKAIAEGAFLEILALLEESGEAVP
ncbi:MAG: hypothetical protein HOL98_06185 [Gammaproteobacteria bacterium]|nr:hypothetical protein [Gammaproteobacteria bacterium]MBT5203031.1 hypothetical protein [Gammaproteobacteria bacterium]MBT5601870.1 hypothetical protein [Gammaproteobacteria bacterium]MBT6245586.1 hypothetical protein [Gammaproteobacteria bacterium]